MWRIGSFLVVLLCACFPATGKTITDDALGFTLNVPEGFISLPAPGGDAIYGFATSFPEKGLPDAVVTISRMHAVLPPVRLNAARLPTPTATLSSAPWQGLDVDVVSDRITLGANVLAIRGALIPLKKEGIQIKVIVPVAKAAMADGVLGEFLAGLCGESNWSASPASPSAKRAHSDYSGVIFAGSLVFFLIAVVIFFRRGRKPAGPA